MLLLWAAFYVSSNIAWGDFSEQKLLWGSGVSINILGVCAASSASLALLAIAINALSRLFAGCGVKGLTFYGGSTILRLQYFFQFSDQ